MPVTVCVCALANVRYTISVPHNLTVVHIYSTNKHTMSVVDDSHRNKIVEMLSQSINNNSVAAAAAATAIITENNILIVAYTDTRNNNQIY